MSVRNDHNNLLSKFIERVSVEYRPGSPKEVEYTRELEEQKKRELSLISQNQACPIILSKENVAARLSRLDPKALRSEVSQQFYNPEVMKAMACLIESLVLDFGPYSLAPNERLRTYISSLNQIGSESAMGYALRGDFVNDDGQNLFIVKAPRSKTNADDLIHECIVAFQGTNALRDLGIPNFAYVYGAFTCSPPIIETNSKMVLTFCNSNRDAVTYAVYENIAPAISFKEFSRTCSPQEFMDYYLQVMIALKCANERCDFTHYDLHYDNVLLRNVGPEPFLIRYPTALSDTPAAPATYIRSSGKVATIIDYGMSHIAVQEEGKTVHYGATVGADYTQYGIFRDRSNPLHDAYKLLCFCFSEMLEDSGQIVNEIEQKYNLPTFTALSGLFKFFEGIIGTNITDVVQLIKDQRQTYYSLPFNGNVWKTLDDWIQTCRLYLGENNLMDPFVDPMKVPSPKILGCFGGTVCPMEMKVLDDVGISSLFQLPTKFLDFYDLYGRYTREMESKDPNEIRRAQANREFITRKFLDDQYFQPILQRETEKVWDLIDGYELFTIYRLPLNLDDLFTPRILAEIKALSASAAVFFDNDQRLRTYLKVIQTISSLKRPANPNLTALLSRLTSFLGDPEYQQMKDSLTVALLTDIQRLERDGKKQEQMAQTSKYAPYRFYWTTYMNLISVLTQN